MAKKMTTEQVMDALSKLEKRWPDGLKLYAHSGLLALVDADTHEVIEYYDQITCDGGDIGIETGDDGVERLAYA